MFRDRPKLLPEWFVRTRKLRDELQEGILEKGEVMNIMGTGIHAEAIVACLTFVLDSFEGRAQ